MAIVVVRGTGDVGSAIAHRLFVAGNTVVLHDQGRPAHARRGVSFVDALFEGRATLQGVHAKLVRGAESLQRLRAQRHVAAVSERRSRPEGGPKVGLARATSTVPQSSAGTRSC